VIDVFLRRMEISDDGASLPNVHNGDDLIPARLQIQARFSGIASQTSTTVELVKFLLERDGHQVLEAFNGKEALERANTEHPDLMGLGLPRFVLNHWHWSMDPFDRTPDPRLFDRARDALAGFLQSDAKALVVIKGFNSGPQVGAGVSQGIGYIKMVAARPPPPPPGPEDFVIVRTPMGLRLHLPNDVLFDFDKCTIKPAAARVLDQVAWTIAELNLPGSRISIEGHTDGIGPPEYNRQLSLRRARSVWHWLVAHNVIKPSDSKVVGWGMFKPLVLNERRPDGSDDPAARARNRRVEIFLTQ